MVRKKIQNAPIKYKAQHKPSVKTVYAKLERNEPFNDIEKAQYSEKERALIRAIQLKNKENKNDAIQTYVNYSREGRKATKALSSSLRNYVKSQYPKHGQTIQHVTADFEPSGNRKKIIQKGRKELRLFLDSKQPKYKNPKLYAKVKKNAKKYPNAGLYECKYGVTSKRSEEWRVKNGLTRNYK